jgi:hypothetical protein
MTFEIGNSLYACARWAVALLVAEVSMSANVMCMQVKVCRAYAASGGASFSHCGESSLWC